MSEPTERDVAAAQQFARDHYQDCELTVDGTDALAVLLTQAHAEGRKEEREAILVESRARWKETPTGNCEAAWKQFNDDIEARVKEDK